MPFRKKYSPLVRNTTWQGEMLPFSKKYSPYALDNPLPPVRAYNPAASPPGGPNLRGLRLRRDRMNADNVCTGDAAVEIATASLAVTSMWGVGRVAS